MVYAVIMAGGIGTRFWPRSRQAHPKQFLNVFGDATLIQNTVARLQGVVPPERCFIVTHERYVDDVHAQLPAVPAENILAEPISKNTAPCIAYAAFKLQARDPNATMIVLPADHVIRNVAAFHEALRVAITQAQEPGALVTIGIPPTHPETGYGYIQYDAAASYSGDGMPEAPAAFRVRTFAEKPDLTTAERFLDSGDFLWNSGMFVWRVDAILDQFRLHLPAAHEAFAPLARLAGDYERVVVAAAFHQCPSISIDYGIMERAGRVYVVPGSFGWSDVGDWRAVYELSDKDAQGNAFQGCVIAKDSSRCLVQGRDRLIALVGIHDTVVIDTGDALLICNRDSAQQVKTVVDYLHAHQLHAHI